MPWWPGEPQTTCSTFTILLIPKWRRVNKLGWVCWEHEAWPEKYLLHCFWQCEKCKEHTFPRETYGERSRSMSCSEFHQFVSYSNLTLYVHYNIFCWLQVLFLVDPIDEIAINNLKSYKEKDFVDISKEDLDLG